MIENEVSGMGSTQEALPAIVEAAASVLALLLSSVSIYQTRKQIELSNKQVLFERRLSGLRTVNELFSHYRIHRVLYTEGCRPYGHELSPATEFINLANVTHLDHMDEWLTIPTNASEGIQAFLNGYERIGRQANEMRLIFQGSAGTEMASFLDAYAGLLFYLYRYETSLDGAAIDAFEMNDSQGAVENQEDSMKARVVNARAELDRAFLTMEGNGTIAKAESQARLYEDAASFPMSLVSRWSR